MGIIRFTFGIITKLLKITFGVALTLAVFFAAGWFIDWNAGKKARMPSDPKFLPYADTIKKEAEKNSQKGTSPDSYTSFFEMVKGRKNELMEDIKDIKEKVEPLTQNAKTKPATAPTDKVSEKKIPETLPQTSKDEKKTEATPTDLTYTIQLGSFQNGEVARAFSDSLSGKGYDAHIVKIEVAGKGTVYRVRIGKYKNIEDAQKVAAELEKKENISAFITSK